MPLLPRSIWGAAKLNSQSRWAPCISSKTTNRHAFLNELDRMNLEAWLNEWPRLKEEFCRVYEAPERQEAVERLRGLERARPPKPLTRFF